MRKDTIKKLLLIFLVKSQIFFYIFSLQGQSDKNFKIFNNGKIIGILKERKENCKRYIRYEKDLQYFNGENIFIKFRLPYDFSYITGEVFRNNKKWMTIKNNEIIATDNGKMKKYILPVGTIPSSIMNLYIHEIFKNGRDLPDKMKVFYENTGDILDVEIKKTILDNCIEIEYNFDKINLQLVEIFFPEKGAYFIRCDPIYFVEEKLENDFIPEIVSNLNKKSNTVITQGNFNGFSDANFILYKLTFASDISIPSDKRQMIIEKKKTFSGWTFLLKVTKDKEIGNEENVKKHTEYLLSFNKLYNIRKLSYEITKGIKDQDAKIQKIMGWIKENINPSKEEIFDPEFVLKEREGDCQGISNLFLTMCSALGISGRAVAGIVIVNKKGKYFYYYHQWVELWENDYWIPYDPSFGLMERGLNYIKLINIERKIDLLKMKDALKFLNKIEIVREE